jgi:hypothetical protein
MKSDNTDHVLYGLMMLLRWRDDNFPNMPWRDLVKIIDKEMGFDDFCREFAAGRMLIMVGDYFDIHIFAA